MRPHRALITRPPLLRFAFFALVVLRLTHAAPTSGTNETDLDSNATFQNEIVPAWDGDAKRFRATYAKRMKSFMNTSADPCDDFYEYACGNFPNAIEDLEGTRKRSNLLDIFYILIDKLDKSLQKKRHPEDEYYDELQVAKQFLNSCVNANLYPMQPSEEYLELIRTIGGFPAVDPNWNQTAFDWLKMTGYLTRYGVEGLMREQIFLKHPFPPYYELPKFGFSFDIYLENIESKDSEGYVYSEKIMKKLLNTYGVSGSQADSAIEGVFEFWREALVMEKGLNEYGACMYSQLFDYFFVSEWSEWNRFFDYAWGDANFNISSMSECPCATYYFNLSEIIARRPEAAANYMALKFLHSMHLELESPKFQRLYCMIRVKQVMPIILSYFYMKEDYSKDSEADIFAIISEIKKSLKQLIETADWLDESTRTEALDKVKTLQARVGEVPHPIFDVFIKMMRNLNLTDNFAANNLKLARYNVDVHHYNYLHPEIDEDTTPVEMLDSVQVNAFYYVLDNSINVMAGVLHPPVYHPSLPNSVNYGSLGYILGHELTHGFDNGGSNFDSDLAHRNWWSESSSKVFGERQACFADHYSQYTIPELNKKINGTASQDENIADNGGLREALSAYRRVYKAGLKDRSADNFERSETLPGLDLTPEQTFFLSFAQVYCAKYTPKHYWVELSDDHPLDMYRVLGTLQNFDEFPPVFNCPVGSPMNPVKKCRLW